MPNEDASGEQITVETDTGRESDEAVPQASGDDVALPGLMGEPQQYGPMEPTVIMPNPSAVRRVYEGVLDGIRERAAKSKK